jgi:hypothetical protein
MEKFIILVFESGSSEESNLWLVCPICNSHKALKIEAISPLTDDSDFDPLEVRALVS